VEYYNDRSSNYNDCWNYIYNDCRFYHDCWVDNYGWLYHDFRIYNHSWQYNNSRVNYYALVYNYNAWCGYRSMAICLGLSSM
jgi:hypothetical protein